MGPQIIIFDTCISSEYYTHSVVNTISYQWLIEPPDAGVINGNSINAIVDWNAGYTGLVANITVEALNNCGSNQSESLIVDISPVEIDHQVEHVGISISPNPSKGIFNISFKELDDRLDLYVLNSNGNIFKHKVIYASDKNYTYRLDLTDKPSGIYYIKFVFKNNVNQEKAIIIQ